MQPQLGAGWISVQRASQLITTKQGVAQLFVVAKAVCLAVILADRRVEIPTVVPLHCMKTFRPFENPQSFRVPRTLPRTKDTFFLCKQRLGRIFVLATTSHAWISPIHAHKDLRKENAPIHFLSSVDWGQASCFTVGPITVRVLRVHKPVDALRIDCLWRSIEYTRKGVGVDATQKRFLTNFWALFIDAHRVGNRPVTSDDPEGH